MLTIGLLPIAQAQVVPGMPRSGAAQIFAQSWDIQTNDAVTNITQSVLPIGIFLPIRDGLEARVSTSYVSLSKKTSNGPTETVSGLTDLKLQANYALLGRRLMLGISLNLPTGQGNLTSQEQDVVFGFVAPDLSVRANRLGEGFNVGTTLSLAQPLSAYSTFGLAAGIVARGAYDTSIPDWLLLN